MPAALALCWEDRFMGLKRSLTPSLCPCSLASSHGTRAPHRHLLWRTAAAPKPDALCQQTLGRRKDVSAPVTGPEVCVACPAPQQKGRFGWDRRWPVVGSYSSP